MFCSLFFVLMPIKASRVVKFKNKTNLPSSLFSYFFISWVDPKSPNTFDGVRGKSMNRFNRFQNQIDLDNVKDTHTKNLIPKDAPVSIEVKIKSPQQKTSSSQDVYIEGTLENAEPITYDITLTPAMTLKFTPEGPR